MFACKARRVNVWRRLALSSNSRTFQTMHVMLLFMLWVPFSAVGHYLRTEYVMVLKYNPEDICLCIIVASGSQCRV